MKAQLEKPFDPQVERLVSRLAGMELFSKMALPIAATGAIISGFLGPAFFLAATLLGATSVLAGRQLRDKQKEILEELLLLKNQNKISPQQYSEALGVINTLTIAGPNETQPSQRAITEAKRAPEEEVVH